MSVPVSVLWQTADGRGMNVEGCITTNRKLGEIDDDIEALVVLELKNQIVLGLRSMKEYKNYLNFGCDKLWTGSTERLRFRCVMRIPNWFRENCPRCRQIQMGTQSRTVSRVHRCVRGSSGELESCGSSDEVPESLPGIYENKCVSVVQEENEKVQADWATGTTKTTPVKFAPK